MQQFQLSEFSLAFRHKQLRFQESVIAIGPALIRIKNKAAAFTIESKNVLSVARNLQRIQLFLTQQLEDDFDPEQLDQEVGSLLQQISTGSKTEFDLQGPLELKLFCKEEYRGSILQLLSHSLAHNCTQRVEVPSSEEESEPSAQQMNSDQQPTKM